MTESASPKGKSNIHIPILLFTVAGLPVIVAFIMYFADIMVPDGRTNKGTLIAPPLSVTMLDLKLQQAGEGDIEGKWELIVFGQDNCASDVCQQTLHKARQVNVALGREAGRVVRRYINIGAEFDAVAAEAFKTSYPRLHLSYTSDVDLEVFLDKELTASEVLEQNYIFISDPLGNVMMFYTPENPGGDLLDDLKKLLKVSKIG